MGGKYFTAQSLWITSIMKIAITGHSAGIGQALAKIYQSQGHEIVGISKRDGNNIQNIPRTIALIKDCDMFINNAQQGYCQTDLMYALYKLWQGVEGKQIMVISSSMTLSPVCPVPSLEYEQYYNQKKALEEATRVLAHKDHWPQITLVKPGEVNTGDHSGPLAVDVTLWAEQLIKCLDVNSKLKVYEITLGPNYVGQ